MLNYSIIICLIVVNVLNAWMDAITIEAYKEQPNHFVNGLLYFVLAVCLWLAYPIEDAWYLVCSIFCLRQLVFDGVLNVLRRRNWFYTSVYTSFYRKWPDTRYSTGSYLDKVENWIIDGCINLFKGRKWSYIHPIIEGKLTFDNYLNGKIQYIIYGTIFVFSILKL